MSLLKALVKRPVSEVAPTRAAARAPGRFPGSVQLRHVDTGSCNGCEIEIASTFGPVCDAGRFGARLVASPRHADGLLVTGVVTKNMAIPLQKTFEAVPRPRVVVACGDCAVDGGVFAGAYGVAGPIDDFVPVDVEIPGCPPNPSAITEALRGLTGR
ncbi:MAG: NADH-quinone oxidoreductase subunit B family protein [Acidimicrobiales bacterium]